MAKAQSYVFDGPAMGPEHSVYLGAREYRRGDVLSAEEIAALDADEAQKIDGLLAREVVRKVSANKPKTGEEV